MLEIVKTEDVLGGKARLAGRRVSVFQIGEMYTTTEYPVEDIADQLDLSLTAVHTALAYYYDHPNEMEAIREQRDALVEDLNDESLAS